MKGREIFEELGFKLSTTNEWQSTFTHADNKGQLFVGFHNTDKSVTVDYFVQRGGPIQERNQSKLSMNLLSAIYKYCKELGWIEEEKKEIKQETNLERYYDNLIKEDCSDFGVVNGKIESCTFIPCEKCEFKPGNCHKNRITWLISECKKKKHKFTQFEYDLIDTYRGSSEICKFHNCYQLRRLKAKGYFNDVDKNESIKDILANCEVGE